MNLFIKDRSNNFGGYYYNRGLFRMHTPNMALEYQLDLFTYRFSYFDDYEWFNQENGFRSFVGSLNTPVFAVKSELKNSLKTGENGSVLIHGYQQEDLRANRGLFTIGYAHHLGRNHNIGIMHSLGQKKTDLDATMFYSYGTGNSGKITAEITLLDWANNFASNLTEERKSEFEIRHSYSRKPYQFTLRLESPQFWIFRGEAVASVQPRSRAEVSEKELPGQNYITDDWVNYQAALLEATFRGGSAGVIFQRTFARMQREPAENSGYELDFGNRQKKLRGGIFFTWQWRSFGVEQWFWIERNEDRQFDENPEAYIEQDPNISNSNRYPFNFKEIRRFNKTRIFYKPEGKFLSAFIEHNGDWRKPAYDGLSETVRAVGYRTYYPNHIVPRNERLTLGFGFRFSERSNLTLGASLDLDNDLNHGFGYARENPKPAVFDGGFGRLQILW